MYERYIKRTIDFIIVLCVLLIIWPFLFVITILLLIFNEGAGAFFTQERPGYKGRIFKIIKFKTMNERKGPDGKLLPDVQRITRFGSLVRRLSIDELPQLINVLKGDMAIIGRVLYWFNIYLFIVKNKHVGTMFVPVLQDGRSVMVEIISVGLKSLN